jgi:hypothetical protein
MNIYMDIKKYNDTLNQKPVLGNVNKNEVSILVKSGLENPRLRL